MTIEVLYFCCTHKLEHIFIVFNSPKTVKIFFYFYFVFITNKKNLNYGLLLENFIIIYLKRH